MIQVIVAFFATIAFSALFNVPKEEYVFCGLTGALGWFCYLVVLAGGQSVVIASFFATMVLTLVSRFFAVYRRMPITIFLISGIFPLVPGAGIYYTAYHLIMNENILALDKGMQTAKIAIAIALGIVLILSLPQNIFKIVDKSKWIRNKCE